MINQESAGNKYAISSAGALGPMQLMPATAKDLGVKNPFNKAENIAGGTKHMNRLLSKYNGNLEYALAAYNWGEGNVDKMLTTGFNYNQLPQETKDYITRITNNYSK